MRAVNVLVVVTGLAAIVGAAADIFEHRRGRSLRARLLGAVAYLLAPGGQRQAQRLDRRRRSSQRNDARIEALRDLRLFGTDGGLWTVRRLPGTLTQRLEVAGLDHRLVLDLYASFGRTEAADVDGATVVSLRWTSTFGWVLCARSHRTGEVHELYGPHLVPA